MQDDGTIVTGVEYVQGSDAKVRLGQDEGAFVIPFFNHPSHGLPRLKEKLIIEAAPRTYAGRKCLSGRGRWTGALLHIRTLNLAFPAHKGSDFGALSNVWRGAETMNEVFGQSGQRSNPKQEQLVALDDGETVFVADANARYMGVLCRTGQLNSFPADKNALASFLARRAKAKCWNSHRALLWTYFTLERLGVLGYWSIELANRTTSLERSSGEQSNVRS